MDGNNDDPPIFAFLTEIGIIAQLSQAMLERALPDGLKLSHFGVLNHFARLGGDWNPARLARAFQVTKGAMTNTLNRLEARGLIEVVPDPDDGRGKLARITTKGLKLREEAIQALAPAIGALAADIDGQGFEDTLPFLQHLRAYLDEARDGTGS